MKPDPKTYRLLIAKHGDELHQVIFDVCDRAAHATEYLDACGRPNFAVMCLVVGERFGYHRQNYPVLDCLFAVIVSFWEELYEPDVVAAAALRQRWSTKPQRTS